MSALFATACGGDLIDPSNPDELSQALVIPGAERIEGSPPSATGSSDAPMISGGSEISATSGEQAVLSFRYTSSSGYQNCYVQVSGASDYFRLGVDGAVNTNEGEIRIPINLPDSVATGSFDLYTCVAGRNGGVSNALNSRFSVTNPEMDEQDEPGDVFCGGAQTVNGCTLDYCVVGNADRCYYRVDGQQIGCSSCSDISSCAQTAADRLIQCSR